MLKKSLVSSLVSRLVNSLIGGVNAVTRVFIGLDPTASAFYSLASPWVTTGDFEIEADFVMPSGSFNLAIVGRGAGNGSASVRIDSTSENRARVVIGSSFYNFNGVLDDLVSGRLYTIRVTHISGETEVFIDDIIKGSAFTISGMVIDVIGDSQEAFYFDGIVSNVKLTDLGTPANSLEYPLDKLLDNTETSNGNVLTYNSIATTPDIRDTYTLVDTGWLKNDEIVINGDFDDGTTSWFATSGAISVVNSQLEVVGTDSSGRGNQNITLTDDITYLFTGKIIEGTGDNISATLFSSGFAESVTALGNVQSEFTKAFTPSVTGSGIIWARAGLGDAYFDDISVRRVIQTTSSNLHSLGDSFVAAVSWTTSMPKIFQYRPSTLSYDGGSGTTLVQQAVRFDSTPEYYDDVLIIMDGGLSDSSGDAITAIDSMVAHLTHDRWLYVQPSPDEFIDGSPDRTAWDADSNAIIAHVGAGHYVECLTVLQSFNNGSVDDLQDVADNIVPRSLRVDNIHETGLGTDIRTHQIDNFIKLKGW